MSTLSSFDSNIYIFLQLAMINQYEVTQEFGNSLTDQANLTVVIDTTDTEKSLYVMRSFPGEKLKVPPFVFKRKDLLAKSDADKIHLEIELMRKMVHPNLQLIRDVRIVKFYSGAMIPFYFALILHYMMYNNNFCLFWVKLFSRSYLKLFLRITSTWFWS